MTLQERRRTKGYIVVGVWWTGSGHKQRDQSENRATVEKQQPFLGCYFVSSESLLLGPLHVPRHTSRVALPLSKPKKNKKKPYKDAWLLLFNHKTLFFHLSSSTFTPSHRGELSASFSSGNHQLLLSDAMWGGGGFTENLCYAELCGDSLLLSSTICPLSPPPTTLRPPNHSHTHRERGSFEAIH